jgi:hypothetical protein
VAAISGCEGNEFRNHQVLDVNAVKAFRERRSSSFRQSVDARRGDSTNLLALNSQSQACDWQTSLPSGAGALPDPPHLLKGYRDRLARRRGLFAPEAEA